jgi:MFS family permease
MLPLRLFRSPTFVAASVSGFLMTAALFSAAFLASQYFQFVLHKSPFDTGVRMLPWTATPMVVAPLAGALSDRIGRRPLMVLGLVMQAGGLVWIALIASASSSYLDFLAPLVVAGVGISMVLPTAATAVVSSVQPVDMGKASGVNSTMQRFGGVFGITVVAAVFAANGHIATPATYLAGFRPAFAAAGALSLLGALTAMAVRPLPAVAAEESPALTAPTLSGSVAAVD